MIASALGRANLEVFADTLLDLARDDPSIVVVASDSRGSGKLVPFGEELPGRSSKWVSPSRILLVSPPGWR